MNDRDITAVRAYHDITKHSWTSVRSSFHSLDWDNRPLPFKIYPTAREVTLPRELLLSAMSTLAVLSGTEGIAQDTAIDLPMVARLLFCADGITRRRRVGVDNYYFRAAASAGALYPIELYLAASEIDGLAPGLYHFSPADMKLRELRRGDWRDFIARATALRRSVLNAQAIVLVSAIFWRSVWKYRARAYRYCFWDAGTILANLFAAANAEKLTCDIVTGFEDAPLELLLGVDPAKEGIVCVMPLGCAPPPTTHSSEPERLALETLPLSSREADEPDLTGVHRATRLTAADEVRSATLTARFLSASGNDETIRAHVRGIGAGLGLGETILRRGSTRVFAREAMRADELAAIVGLSAMQLPADFPASIEIYAIVNAVEQMAPGAYYWQRDAGRFQLLKAGNFRNEAGYLCLEQVLGADASALLCYMTDLEQLLAIRGSRAYREAHLEAGVIGGRTYLAAYTLGRGATGLTFYDDDTSKFFSPGAASKSPILMVAVGVPSRK